MVSYMFQSAHVHRKLRAVLREELGRRGAWRERSLEEEELGEERNIGHLRQETVFFGKKSAGRTPCHPRSRTP
jgi:hypothetical protein